MESNLSGKKIIYQTDMLSLQSFSKLLSALRNVCHSIRASIKCPDNEVIQELNLSLNIKKKSKTTEEINKIISSRIMLGQNNVAIEEVRKYKHRKVIDLVNKTVANIFVNEYRERLVHLASHFNLFLILDGSLIKIYSQNTISSLFQSQILAMKHQLKWFHVNDQKFTMKLKLSKIIKQQLQKMKIRFIALRYNCLLHSSYVSLDDIKKAISYLSYDAVILNFNNQNCSKNVNRTYLKMIIYHLAPTLRMIKENYEIECQINCRKMGLIIHNRDPIFSQQPINQLNKLLSNLIFIVYYAKNPAKHFIHIKNCQQKSKCLNTMMTKNYIFLSWNTNLAIQLSQISSVFSKFVEQLNEKSTLKIGYRTGGLNKNLITNIQNLAQKHKLHAFRPKYFTQIQQFTYIQLKSFSTALKRQKMNKMMSFLCQLLTGKTMEAENFDHQQNQNIIDDSEWAIQQNNSLQNAFIEQVTDEHQMPLHKENTFTHLQPVRQNENTCYLYHKLRMPKIISQQNVETKKGKRNFQLEQYLTQKFSIISQVWKLQHHLQQPRNIELEQQKLCKLFIVDQNEVKQGTYIIQPKLLHFSQLREDHEYCLVCQTDEPSKYILTHRLVVYGS